MRAVILITCAIFFFSAAAAQQFQPAASIPLDAGARPSQVLWADLDNDSLLDIIMVDSGQHPLVIRMFTKPVPGPALQTLLTTSYRSGTVAARDVNQDNKIDLVLSGVTSSGMTGTQFFLNQGGFSFQSTNSTLPGSTKIDFRDLNNDGMAEAIMIKTSGSLAVFKNSHNVFTPLFDSTHVAAQDFTIYDVDGNGFNDLVVSGRNQSGLPVLFVLEFKDNFDTLRTLRITPAVSGRLRAGDLDHNGFFDLVAAGETMSGNLVTQTFLNSGTQFTNGRSYAGLENTAMEIADLDSDGKADVGFLGRNTLNQSVAWINTNAGDSLILPGTHTLQQAFGDYDRDGDLDLLQATDTLSLVILENSESRHNQGPAFSPDMFGAQLFSRFFIFWDTASDDRTPAAALTYDLAVSGAHPIVSGEFDLTLHDRLLVTYGNQGTRNFDLLRATGSFSFQVQPVDNAYNPTGRVSGSGGGTGVPGQSCTSSVTVKSLAVCDSAAVKLSAGGAPAFWFSFSDGFVGRHDTLTVKPAAHDTLFSFVPKAQLSCSNLTVFLLQQQPTDTVRISLSGIACVDSLAVLTVDTQWQGVTWKNISGAIVAHGDSISYSVTKSETLMVAGKNNHGCTLLGTAQLRPDIPIVSVNGEDFKVTEGQSVQLIASGATAYRWAPAAGLNDDAIANPLATPSATTTYTVTGRDSIGCIAQNTVLVEVTGSPFLPTLFTPNGDGKNDELRVYGLDNPKNFHLTIFNREGAIVYETTDWTIASTQGWNGAHNGTSQPSGLYYWKVEGNADQGGVLQVNGKTKGSVLLLR
jgi:gliding motility-associated-like protein